MCGIVGYVGPKRAAPILLDGLRRLEYRGYDSAGVALVDGGTIRVHKEVGKVAMVQAEVPADAPGHTGIAHTRWATHGSVTQANAHPHTDMQMGIAVVHNGIIDNDAALRVRLAAEGVEFCSETDTEVLPHLIRHHYKGDPTQAVIDALKEVRGTYGVVVAFADHPGVMVAARLGSPLVIGLGEDENFIASDPHALVRYTRRVIYLEDHELATITADGVVSQHLDGSEALHTVEELEAAFGTGDKGAFEHYMLKEIFEQPRALRTCIQGRIDHRAGQVVLGGVSDFGRDLAKAKRIVFVGQGTALNAAMIGEYLMEDLAKIPTDVEFASEFRYRNPIVEEGTVVIAISQSGETADTLAAMQEARQKGAMGLGVVNVVGSSISRETDAGVYLRVGPEIGVASTKAFVGQVMVNALLATFIGRRRFLSQDQVATLLNEMTAIPDKIERVLEQSDSIRDATSRFVARENWLFLGRGVNYPVAMEGALKLKEISYIHAEGMPAAEMKHGPIALIDDGMPVVFIATRNSQYEKVVSNIEEVRSRGGHVIAVATEGDKDIARLCEAVFYVPDVIEPLQPLVSVIPLQLLAYHAAVLRGKDVDKPRNLAKSVTVE